MSFEINWEALTSDESINSNIKNFLDQQFNSISLPSFIDKLSVSDFSMGSTPPEIIIRHIGAPFEEFYSEGNSDDEERRDSTPLSRSSSDTEESQSSEEEEENSNTSGIKTSDSKGNPLLEGLLEDSGSAKSSDLLNQLHNYNMNNLGLGPHERETPKTFFQSSALKFSSQSIPEKKASLDTTNDIQFILEIDYRGDIMIEVSVNLLVNYPSAEFISLPIKLKITDLEIHSLAAIAYIQQSVYISFLCDLNTSRTDYFSMLNSQDYYADSRSKTPAAPFQGGNFVDYGASNNKERIDVIRNVKIDTEIGENENNVLRNVGKVEKFLVEQLRNIIRDEVCWPGWICIDLREEEDSPEDKSK
ncbi:hypothetical protein JCM33374_g6400 [Metschnikowia sp. JCM 33374]|nr:hypothetical protein JCM33374_g6400 [Metschnikowia sp. JCM 33374]